MIRAASLLLARLDSWAAVFAAAGAAAAAAHLRARSARRARVAGRAGRRRHRHRPADGRALDPRLRSHLAHRRHHRLRRPISMVEPRRRCACSRSLAETIIRQGRFRSSTRSGEARADYEIRWEVLDFEVREETMQAHFRADVRLVAPGRRIIASQMIETTAPVRVRVRLR